VAISLQTPLNRHKKPDLSPAIEVEEFDTPACELQIVYHVPLALPAGVDCLGACTSTATAKRKKQQTTKQS
jgi:hypothetical protein